MAHPIPLALPDFIYAQPTLAAGGGAEVVSLAWLSSHGLSTDFPSISSPLTSEYIPDELQHHQSPPAGGSTPFGFDDCPGPPPAPPPLHNSPDFSILQRPLPVYSGSGFDLLTILARIATRPNPRVFLGSVDLKCSFVVVDTRRYDSPIVYCSPSFCSLTGYPEHEIIGRNCRFLQDPAGQAPKGLPRKHTSHDAVTHLKKSLIANKECQTTIRNFRKDGSAFMNMLTVIPLPGGASGSLDQENEYVYHVGFQVDLAQQPNAILDKSQHGSFLINYSTTTPLQSPRDRKSNSFPPVVMSNELKKLIADPSFLMSIPLSTSTTTPASQPHSSSFQDDPVPNTAAASHLLHLLLLEAAPDFIHVVCLKGSFLYVAPSVRRVLGYEPDEMVGKSISDFAHPKDVDPLKRELRESSSVEDSRSSSSSPPPRTVNLLFRARTKFGFYVWIECRGRLHVEPGKGKKAIILSGRASQILKLNLNHVRFAGGLVRGGRIKEKKRVREANCSEGRRLVDQEVWGMISGNIKETMTFVSVGKGVEDVLGWSSDELVGRNVMDIVLDECARTVLGSFIVSRRPERSDDMSYKRVQCLLKKKGNGVADVWFVIYRVDEPDFDVSESSSSPSISFAPFVYQIRLVEARTILPDLVSDSHNTTQRLTSLSPSSYQGFSDPSSSSLAGAVPNLDLPSSSSSSSSVPSSAIPSTTTAVAASDMFGELAISKRTSWQYELQQLRFANARLREELVAFIDGGGVDSGGGSGSRGSGGSGGGDFDWTETTQADTNGLQPNRFSLPSATPSSSSSTGANLNLFRQKRRDSSITAPNSFDRYPISSFAETLNYESFCTSSRLWQDQK